MSSAVKTALGVLVLIVIVGGIYWYLKINTLPVSPAEVAGSQEQNAGSDSANGLPSRSAMGDDALAQDLGAIDGHVGGFAGDNTSVTQSLSDQSIEQSTF